MADERCCIGRGVAGIRHKTGARSYTYYAMRTLEESLARFEAEGTVFGSINKNDFHNLVLVTPPPDLLVYFESVVGLLDDRIETNENQSCILADLRDILLPKLIYGEQRVKAAGPLITESLSV